MRLCMLQLTWGLVVVELFAIKISDYAVAYISKTCWSKLGSHRTLKIQPCAHSSALKYHLIVQRGSKKTSVLFMDDEQGSFSSSRSCSKPYSLCFSFTSFAYKWETSHYCWGYVLIKELLNTVRHRTGVMSWILRHSKAGLFLTFIFFHSLFKPIISSSSPPGTFIVILQILHKPEYKSATGIQNCLTFWSSLIRSHWSAVLWN